MTCNVYSVFIPYTPIHSLEASTYLVHTVNLKYVPSGNALFVALVRKLASNAVSKCVLLPAGILELVSAALSRSNVTTVDSATPFESRRCCCKTHSRRLLASTFSLQTVRSERELLWFLGS
jgi:hypothetical protein